MSNLKKSSYDSNKLVHQPSGKTFTVSDTSVKCNNGSSIYTTSDKKKASWIAGKI